MKRKGFKVQKIWKIILILLLLDPQKNLHKNEKDDELIRFLGLFKNIVTLITLYFS